MDAGKLIRRSIRNQIKKGFKLVRCTYGSLESKTACPIRCIGLDGRKNANIDYSLRRARKVLNKPFEWVSSFMEGFDSPLRKKITENTTNERAFRLGQRIYKEFIPIHRRKTQQ